MRIMDRHRNRSRKTPTIGRKLCVALFMCSLPGPTFAQPDAAVQAPLDEAEVIHLARTRSPAGAVAKATDALADAHARTAGPLPNPSLSWMRETIQSGPLARQGSQDIVSAALPIDIARPLATRSLVASESAWLSAEAALARDEAILGAVLAYCDAVLAGGECQGSCRFLLSSSHADWAPVTPPAPRDRSQASRPQAPRQAPCEPRQCPSWPG